MSFCTKADVGISHQTEKKKMLVYVPGTYISLSVLALEEGVNSNPSSRERLFLRTANPRQETVTLVIQRSKLHVDNY